MWLPNFRTSDATWILQMRSYNILMEIISQARIYMYEQQRKGSDSERRSTRNSDISYQSRTSTRLPPTHLAQLRQIGVRHLSHVPFHCHIAWHASAGFFSQMLFLPDEVRTYRDQVPYSIEQTCAEWREFTATQTVNQIDSGL